MIYVNKADSTPLYQQLYTSIIEEITNGSLPKDSALPPIRTLSEKLNISLNTVSKAYLQLTAEGYVRSVPGSGYYVEDISNTFLDTLSVPPVSKKIISSISGQNPAPKATPVRYDFKHDVDPDNSLYRIRLNDYIRNLPTVTVGGVTYKFVNGIGFGIDGYCCEEGDRQRAAGRQDINYSAIAVKGCLFRFKPYGADITVDGETRHYDKVWLAPTMFGKYYGGGMKVAPEQDRNNPQHTVTNVVIHGTGRLKTLIRFAKIFSGEHTKYTDMVDIRTGHEVRVVFDRPCALQIDGETVKNVTEYTVRYE